MITVKLFGVLRLDCGIKELRLEASDVRELYKKLLGEIRSADPASRVTAKDLEGCIVVINGVEGKKNSRLAQGDTVMLMSPVCGG